MGNSIRVSLTGYDALTDTNLDHYALYADQDNILIKEFTRGTASVAYSGSAYVVPHNLGYVPYFQVYCNNFTVGGSGTSTTFVPHWAGGFSVPPIAATADGTNVYIFNNNGTATYNFFWYIFYDNVAGSISGSIASSKGIKVTKQGKDISSTDPNDYIFHSSLNTFKILKEGTTNINYTSGTTGGNYSFNHNAGISNPTSYSVYMKFPDGKTAFLPGQGIVYSYDSNWTVSSTYITATQLQMYIQGTGNAILPIKYYIYETPLI
jgi:hypothetical protein